MKKSLSLLMVLLLVVIFALPAQASTNAEYSHTDLEDHTHAINETDSANQLLRYIPCPGGGKHNMRSVANGFLYYGSSSNPGSSKIHGTIARCDGCRTYMFVQYYPGAIINYIGAYKWGGAVASYGGISCMFDGPDGSYWSLTEDSFIQGFQFLM